jgi:hypothetical protein
VRFAVRDGDEDCEVDVGIDYRALDSMPTRYGPALDLRELGADKVLAIFGRAEPRDFVDLAELTRRVRESLRLLQFVWRDGSELRCRWAFSWSRLRGERT